MSNLSTDSVSPGNVELIEIAAEKFDSGRRIDLRAIVGSMRITLGINSHTIFANLMLVDNINLLNNDTFAFTGEEFIHITFRSRGTDNIFSYKFIVSKMDIELKSPSGDSSTFILTLLSVDSFINASAFKSKGYAGTITSIIRQILETELNSEIQINENRFVDTEESNTFGFTEIKPFEKIDILKLRAYSKSQSITSNFFFYENRLGYNFETFENMIERAASNTTVIEYTHTPLAVIDRETNFNTILNFSPRSTFNNHRRLYHGLYNSNVKALDFLTKGVTKTELSLLEKFEEVPHLNRSDPGISSTFSDKIKNIGSLTYYVPFDSSTNDNTPDVLLNNSPFSILVDENSLLIKTFGNLTYDIGDPLNVVILDNETLDNENKKEDPRYSGTYIIHSISYEIGIDEHGYTMFNNMLLIREGALRNADHYNKQYTTNEVKISAVVSRS
jgi:hypothetical protein